MKEQRVYFYDLIKSVAIYLVCLSHFGTLDFNITPNSNFPVYFAYFVLCSCSIGVPLFLMVNGSLLLNRGYEITKHVYKIVMIYLLYWLWGAITLLGTASKFGDHYSFSSLIQHIYYTREGRTNHLWFLIALVYIYLLFPLVKALYDKNEKKLTIYLAAIVFLFTFGVAFLGDILNVAGYIFNIQSWKIKEIGSFPLFNPFNLYCSYALFYFLIGGWLGKYLKNINFKTLHYILLLLVSWVLLFLFGWMKTNINEEVYDPVWNGYNTIMTLVMSFCVFYLCSRISLHSEKLKNVIKTLSSNTLGIYFIHVPLGFWLTGFYEKLAISNYFLVDLCYTLLLVFVSLAIALIMRRIPIIDRLVKI